MSRKPPLLGELAPANRAERWLVQHRNFTVNIAARTAWEAWRRADIRDAQGIPLPFGAVRVRPEPVA